MRGLHQRWRLLAAGLIGLAVNLTVFDRAAAQEWLPLSQEELTMTSEPKAAGAPAIYLFRQVDRNDSSFHESHYERLKILTEEGRKYADIEIPFEKGTESVSGIAARTVQPDGTIIPFTGTIYEKPLVSARGVKLMSKTLSLPAAGVGSIIEVRYDKHLRFGWVDDSHWIIRTELYTRAARFSLEPNEQFPLRWSWPRGIPGGGTPRSDHGRIRL